MGSKLSYQERRDKASAARRRAILKAAGLCFSESGYRKTRTDTIAQRAGVSKGLVFHLFGNKEALFSAVVEDSLEQWSMLSDFRASEHEGDIFEELKSLFVASFDFVDQNPVLALFARPSESILAQYKKDFDRKNRNWRNRIKRTIKRGISSGQIQTEIDIDRLTVIFHELQTALIQNTATSGGNSYYDRITVELAIDLLLRGIRA